MSGIGLLLLLAQIGCAIHAGKTGRPFFWIYLIIFIPMFGMLAYFAVELAPEMLRSRAAQQTASGVSKALDPGRELREAERRLNMTPTAENQARVAEAYLQAGRTEEAMALFQEALTGIHATDPGMMMGLARTHFARNEFREVQEILDKLREANPDYISPEGHLLYARSLEAQGKTEEALEEYKALAPYYPGQEARCRYALLLRKAGRADEARHIFEEICQEADMAPRHAKRLQREWYELARRSL